jgi:hypothetical protein
MNIGEPIREWEVHEEPLPMREPVETEPEPIETPVPESPEPVYDPILLPIRKE